MPVTRSSRHRVRTYAFKSDVVTYGYKLEREVVKIPNDIAQFLVSYARSMFTSSYLSKTQQPRVSTSQKSDQELLSTGSDRASEKEKEKSCKDVSFLGNRKQVEDRFEWDLLPTLQDTDSDVTDCLTYNIRNLIRNRFPSQLDEDLLLFTDQTKRLLEEYLRTTRTGLMVVISGEMQRKGLKLQTGDLYVWRKPVASTQTNRGIETQKSAPTSSMDSTTSGSSYFLAAVMKLHEL